MKLGNQNAAARWLFVFFTIEKNHVLICLFVQTAAQSVQPTAVPPLNQGGEFSDLTELSHADLNGLVSEIEGEDEIFKQFGNFELDNIFAEFDEKVRLTSLKDFFSANVRDT